MLLQSRLLTQITAYQWLIQVLHPANLVIAPTHIAQCTELILNALQQVRKLQDKVSKSQDNVKKCREQYEIAVSDITNYNSRYQEVR